MHNFIFFSLAMFLVSCVTVPLMQESYFNQVATGSLISEVEIVYGSPFQIRQLPSGLQEYIYIQRINLGRSAIEQMEYIFLVNQGIVVSKDCKQSGTPCFQLHQ